MIAKARHRVYLLADDARLHCEYTGVAGDDVWDAEDAPELAEKFNRERKRASSLKLFSGTLNDYTLMCRQAGAVPFPKEKFRWVSDEQRYYAANKPGERL